MVGFQEFKKRALHLLTQAREENIPLSPNELADTVNNIYAETKEQSKTLPTHYTQDEFGLPTTFQESEITDEINKWINLSRDTNTPLSKRLKAGLEAKRLGKILDDYNSM